MGNEGKTDDGGKAGAIAAIANSPVALKLTEALKCVAAVPQNMVNYIVGPDRVRAIGQARADVSVIEARAQAEIDRLSAETHTTCSGARCGKPSTGS